MYEEKVAELCYDYDANEQKGYELLPMVAYTNALSSAIAFYQKAKPRTASFVARPISQRYIPIPNNLTPPFDPATGSKVENIEFITRDASATNLYEKQTMMSLVRKDVYVVEYSDELSQWIIRFIGKITGTYKVTYSYYVNSVDGFTAEDEKQGLIYLAASFACDKISAKFARVFIHKIPSDLAAYREKYEYYSDLANEYREIAYNILDINEKTGTMAYSTVASWGVRKVRRII